MATLITAGDRIVVAGYHGTIEWNSRKPMGRSTSS